MSDTRIVALTILLCVSAFGQGGSSTSPPTGVMKTCTKKNLPPCATSPRALQLYDPEYSEQARKKKVQGTVVLMLVVGTDGHTHDIRVTRHLGHGLDEQAIKAVEQWTFEPGTYNGVPVPVQIDVEVTFKLYK